MWTDSYLKDCVGFQLGAWWFKISSKNKVNITENEMKLAGVCLEIWQQTYSGPNYVLLFSGTPLKANGHFFTVFHDNSLERLYPSQWIAKVPSMCISECAMHSLANGKCWSAYSFCMLLKVFCAYWAKRLIQILLE